MNESPVTVEEAVKDLSLLSLFISIPVQDALQAALVTQAADMYFLHLPEQRRERFRTNPANTLPYRALKGLTERAIVAVTEAMQSERKLYRVNPEIRRKRELILGKSTSKRPSGAKALGRKPGESGIPKRDLRDSKIAMLWDLNRAVSEDLRRHGEHSHIEALTVTADMASMLTSILELSRGPALEVDSAHAQLVYLEELVPWFVDELERTAQDLDAA